MTAQVKLYHFNREVYHAACGFGCRIDPLLCILTNARPKPLQKEYVAFLRLCFGKANTYHLTDKTVAIISAVDPSRSLTYDDAAGEITGPSELTPVEALQIMHLAQEVAGWSRVILGHGVTSGDSNALCLAYAQYKLDLKNGGFYARHSYRVAHFTRLSFEERRDRFKLYNHDGTRLAIKSHKSSRRTCVVDQKQVEPEPACGTLVARLHRLGARILGKKTP